MHRDRAAVARCNQCLKPVCEECLARNGAHTFCSAACATRYRDYLRRRPPETSAGVQGQEPIGVPRRFGLGSVIACVILASLVSALLPLPDSLAILGFMLVVGLAQWRFGPGPQARWVSMATGGVVFVVLLVPRGIPAGACLFEAAYGLFLGSCFGYLAGVLVAGAFLIAARAEGRSGRRAMGPDPPAPPVPPVPSSGE